MGYTSEFEANEPARAAVDAMPGTVVLEFGTPWCGHCQEAQPALEQALAGRPEVRHIKIEDGRGRPLGRSFGVKLWPTIVVLRDGAETARMVRPPADEIGRTLGSG
jgi:thioredoxin 1